MSDIVSRFNNLFIKGTETECWLWQGTLDKTGYGRFNLGENGTVTQTTAAHRFSYEQSYGPIPPEKQCLHRCDVKRCVNPKHLYLGTHDDNMRDRSLRGLLPQGENYLVKDKRQEVVEWLKQNTYFGSLTEAARRFNVDVKTIQRIQKKFNLPKYYK